MHDEFETQVAKIRIGNQKQTTSFVSIIAENSEYSQAELYMVVELPLFNPAAIPDCERIAQAIASSLRRGFRGSANEETFEDTIAHVNEELSKLTNVGQSNWVGKLNAVIAAKVANQIHVATTGKVIAMLLRKGELVNLADTQKKPNVVKTFENFASGVIQLSDVFLLSTTSLFNYISLDEFKRMARNIDVTTLAKNVSDTLESNAGPDIAFGTLLIYETEPGTVIEETPEDFMKSAGPSINSTTNKSFKNFLSTSSLKTSKLKKLTKSLRIPTKEPTPPAVSFKGDNGSHGSQIMDMRGRAKEFISSAKVKYSSKHKKIFFISASVLFIALIVNIFATRYYKQQKQETSQLEQTLAELQTYLSNAESTRIAGDREAAGRLLAQFAEKAKDIKANTPSTEKRFSEEQDQYERIIKDYNKQLQTKVVSLGSFSASSSKLVTIPENIVGQTQAGVINFNMRSNQIQDGALRCDDKIKAAVFWKEMKVFAYNGQNLYICDLQTGAASGIFAQMVPAEFEFGGMTFYPTGNKLYTINKATKQIISYDITNEGIARAKVWADDPKLASGSSLAVDGSMYAFASGEVLKYTSGKAETQKVPVIYPAFTGNGIVSTNKDMANVYVLEPQNNRITIFTKAGELVGTIAQPEFTSLIDFSIDEKSKIIYVLNGDTLLKATYSY